MPQTDANARVVTAADLSVDGRTVASRVATWPAFASGPRRTRLPLLGRLPRHPDCVLVAGCQRSGTTMLTRVIANSAGFHALRITRDDELDAALALCGAIDLPVGRRYCLQTTYLNDRFAEYAQLGPGQRLVWVVRNPYSVVRSMVYNWRRFALDELYEQCGRAAMESSPQPKRRWPFGMRAIEKACWAYVGKSSQLLQLLSIVPQGRLLVVDYDKLARDPAIQLPPIFEFVGEPFQSSYVAAVRGDHHARAETLTADERRLIDVITLDTYRQCCRVLSGERAA